MILDHFPPGYEPRSTQVQVLTEVEAAFAAGHRFVFVEAPPGTGKSLIAMTLARRYGSAYVCTLTKMLQRQYVNEFESIGARELKGKSSFHCDKVGLSCEVGDEQETKCSPLQCPYRLAKAEALNAVVAVCNYYSYLYAIGVGRFSTQAQIPPFADADEERHWHRPLLVLDEGHEAEAVLLDMTSVTIDASKLPIRIDAPFPSSSSAAGCFAWLELFMLAVGEVVPEELSAKALKELNELAGKASFALAHRDAEEWIAEPLDRKEGFALKPLTIKSFAHRLFRYGDRTVLMSATILDAEKMAESLGITEYVYVTAPCPFAVENRSVVVSGLNMTKAHRGVAWPKMVDQIRLIMESHSDEKGLILTPSNEMLEYILSNLPKEAGRRLILARGKDRMENYQRHLDSALPTVLAASGFWEGADLKDESSRFQIIPAIPRPYWGGQVAARGKIDPVWYRLQSYSQLIQGLGRSVRSSKDYCSSYVLDMELKKEAQRHDSLLPPWFKEALVFA